MSISDNGHGFDAEDIINSTKTRRLGILGMRERVEMIGGIFSIESLPGKSTTVIVKVPLEKKLQSSTENNPNGSEPL